MNMEKAALSVFAVFIPPGARTNGELGRALACPGPTVRTPSSQRMNSGSAGIKASSLERADTRRIRVLA
jgi:hypothetical protein